MSSFLWFSQKIDDLQYAFYQILYIFEHLCKAKFTLLKSNFFPAKFSFYKIQKKNLAEKKYFAKE
jgi:hypothetical protein